MDPTTLAVTSTNTMLEPIRRSIESAIPLPFTESYASAPDFSTKITSNATNNFTSSPIYATTTYNYFHGNDGGRGYEPRGSNHLDTERIMSSEQLCGVPARTLATNTDSVENPYLNLTRDEFQALR